ncbi:MAG TPA: hypothetical protein VFA20_28400 [Myxococcaceae bacterium]|nr:hypothetical protein [Myxococcaceae bacterium]
MAEPIDGFKPATRAPAPASSERTVPAQQARPGWRGFLGGSYFEMGAGYAPSKDQHMLDPPATTGPKATAKRAIAQTLEALGLAPGAGILIPPERA